MELKAGTRFVHNKWLDESHNPQVCVVTAVRRGWVYWRCEDCQKAKMKFWRDDASQNVREILS